MTELVCPTCLLTTVGSSAEAVCPRCGTSILDQDPDGENAQWLKPDDEAALVAGIRDAFDISLGWPREASSHSFESSLATPGSKLRASGEARVALSLQPEASSATVAEGVEDLHSPYSSGLTFGRRLGDFEIINAIGHGGMGIVYRARQISLNREVALKVLPAIARYRSSSVRRFRTEAQAVARLTHPNVVPVFAHGEHDGHLYYAMELVEGVSLDAAIRSCPDLLSSTTAPQVGTSGSGLRASREEPLACSAVSEAPSTEISRARDDSSRIEWFPNEEGVRASAATPLPRTTADFRHMAGLIAGVADGLAHAHERGVVHRDVKPHNLLLDTQNRLRLTDFGLAHLTDEPHVTTAGEVMGTPAYLSPEQARGDGREITPCTDIYSLGATLYEMITRRRPFDGRTREQILKHIRMSEPKRPRFFDSRIPFDLETICLRAMDKNPRRRHESAEILADDLRRFAEGKPILSRRTGPLERAMKWTLRRKAAAILISVLVALLLLAAGLFSAAGSARHRFADQVLRHAYDYLAYDDYRSPEQVSEEIEQAREFGADPQLMHKVEALAGLGSSDPAGSIEHIEAYLLGASDDSEARYMLAWAQRRNRDAPASRSTFDLAEASGGPQTAAAWFFRGLTVHFDRPAVAIESYRRASTLRARDRQFYPQAVLHLARSYNQQMYVTRTLESFADAELELRQLIEHEYYGAYPYYLLSITHRLAGDIRAGAGDAESLKVAQAHFAEALRLAGEGRAFDPTDDRPLTAKAECLERLGLLDQAIEARTQVIQLAERQQGRCESYHYRWRLHYWTGDFESALSDIREHAKCMPESRFYAHVYPALVHAEMGNMQRALDEVWAMFEESPQDAQTVIWTATCLRLLGQVTKADVLLDEQSGRVDFAGGLTPPQTEPWIKALYEFSAGQGTLTDLLVLTESSMMPRKLLGEAYFHAAVRALVEGRRDQAIRRLDAAYNSFDSELRYTFHAKIIREKLEAEHDWPAWLQISN